MWVFPTESPRGGESVSLAQMTVILGSSSDMSASLTEIFTILRIQMIPMIVFVTCDCPGWPQWGPWRGPAASPPCRGLTGPDWPPSGQEIQINKLSTLPLCSQPCTGGNVKRWIWFWLWVSCDSKLTSYRMTHKSCNIIESLLFMQQIESKSRKAQNLLSMKNRVMTTMPSLSQNLLSCNTDK